MNAGQFFTLEEVIDFYDEGGGENEMTGRAGNKTSILKPLGLTDDEKEANDDLIFQDPQDAVVEAQKTTVVPFPPEL